MTPLGHISISLLAGIGIAKALPNAEALTVLTATVAGGVILDLDLLYRFYQKRGRVFDKTIGQHRFFPTHTPLYVLSLWLLIALVSFLLSAPQILTWGAFFAIGAILHLFLDTLFFPEGINFAYPFSQKTTKLFTVRTHKFWASKRISGVDRWYINYFKSPLFWIFEVAPAIIALALLANVLASK